MQVAGTGRVGLFGFEPPKVRVEVRAKDKCVSRPVSASYGFEDATGEVQAEGRGGGPEGDRAEHRDPDDRARRSPQKTVGVHLLDATSGAELAVLEKVEVAISI